MIKSLLVGLDGSAPSMAALEEGTKWAALLGAELRGLFVEDEQRFLYYPAGFSAEGGMPIPSPLPAEQMEAENGKVRQEGARIRAAFEKVAAAHDLRGEFTQVRGNVTAVLTGAAKAADLLVMGRRGMNDPPGSKEAGPTTESLIHNALRPTLVVPGKPAGDGPIVFAYDGSKGAQRIVAPGTHLAAAAGGRVSVISIGADPPVQAEQREILQRYWAPYGIQAEFHFPNRKGRVSSAIVEFARQEGAGLIAMGAFGHHPLHELFFGSTTLETIARAHCPVLLMA